MIRVKMIINGIAIANFRDMLFLHDIKIATRITLNRMESRMLSAIEMRGMSQLLDGEKLFSLKLKAGTRVEYVSLER
ncbi:adenosine deaminase [Aliivibrio fischeri]|nr:adenosine deaminase [Aliivibrio fischeri]MUK67885.1 adenosine deaminase [Aliivibrio fischeri]MUK72832.1 adenosine deaminase [Aliivibrio fischeri]MUL19377.1 adenosine deaminase [Aliivibrio fischeri]MUL26478.1 adenosine deaminase [Aliivibrio fischeri]